MANIRAIIDYTITDGSEVLFKSPLDYSSINGLTVVYPDVNGIETSKDFTFVDAHRNDVTQLSDLFAQNAIVKVLVDCTNGLAFIQNADTNAYLEEKFSRAVYLKGESEDVELLPEPIYEDAKGVPGGIATLDDSGKVPLEQLTTHASTHANDGSDPITPSMIGAASSNPNLLHNWYFVKPVNRNQMVYFVNKGTQYYSDTTLQTVVGTVDGSTKVFYGDGVYGRIVISETTTSDDGTETTVNTTYYVDWNLVQIGFITGNAFDRWRFNNPKSSIVLQNDGIKFTSIDYSIFLLQNIYNSECLTGKTVTISMKVVSGTSRARISITDDVNAYARDVNAYARSEYISNGLTYTTVTLPNEISGNIRVGFNLEGEGEAIIEAVKLELGDIQTLAHQDNNGNWVLNEIPDYTEQYIICEQYSPITGEFVGSQHSNPNLLDNWYFAADNVIDQRNGYIVPPDTLYYSDTGLTTQVGTVTTYTKALYADGVYGSVSVDDTTYYVDWTKAVRGYISTGSVYSIDRWKLEKPLILQEDEDGIILDNSANTAKHYFFQKLDCDPADYVNKTVTLSVLTDSGLRTATEIFESTNAVVLDTSFDDIVLRWQISGAQLVQFVIFAREAKKVKIFAAKLELGSVQTLAHQDADGNWVLNDPPPNKALELAKCQRYFLAIPPAYGKFAGSANATTNEVAFFIPTPVEMRANPSPISTLLAFNVETGVYPNREADLVFYKSSNGLIVIATSEEQIASKPHAATVVGNYETIYIDANL